MSTHYETLGVPFDASQAQIRDRFTELAKEFHPDGHSGKPPEVVARYSEAMSRITDAYTQLKDPERRADYDASLPVDESASGATPAASRMRHPSAGECSLCAHGPAREFSFRHQRAWLLGATVHGMETELCRLCAQTLGRSSLNRTLWTGWFGVFAFFRNWLYVASNAKGLFVARGMPDPAPPKDDGVVEVAVPLYEPMLPGKTIFSRSGPWFAALLLLIGFGVAAAADDGPSTYGSGGSGGPAGSAAEWSDDVVCVRESGGFVTPLSSCSGGDGRVVDVVGASHDCPSNADYYIREGVDVYCIAEF